MTAADTQPLVSIHVLDDSHIPALLAQGRRNHPAIDYGGPPEEYDEAGQAGG